MAVEARVALDSVSPEGDRLTTVIGTMHRPALAENNTHRGLSKSSASSRAIPITKQLRRVKEDPALPLVWASEIPGMQGGPPLEGDDLQEAQELFARIREYTISEIEAYVQRHPLAEGTDDTRLHKSWLSRPLEWFMWHEVIVSGTDAMWENFFRLRSTYFTDKAWAEMAAFADVIYDAMSASTPTPLDYGEWHTPLIREDDDFSIFGNSLEARKFISVGRVCRVSYLTHDGRRDMWEDLRLAGRLATERPMHAAPYEMVATPIHPQFQRPGNFRGWGQLRHYVEEEIAMRPEIEAMEFIKEKIAA